MMRARGRRPAILTALLLAAALAAGSAAAQPAADLRAATQAVMRQLEAFRRDDFDTAYTFASAMIRGLFDRRAFEGMVRNGYPEIARSASVLVSGSGTLPNGGVLLHLRIRGANGNCVEASYELVREDGGFKINGVVTRPDTSESAEARTAG
jgi:hypothetical protein